MPHASRLWSRLGGAAAGAVTLVVATALPALAAQGSIDHVQAENGKLQILYSVLGEAQPDLDTISVAIGDTSLRAVAEQASTAQQVIRRTTVLAMDVSDSMAGPKFEAAKAAAETFLSTAPADLYVGLVTFAGSVQRVAEPSTDHEGLKETIGALELSRGTELYNGVKEAVAATGTQGARSVLVLSDGADSTGTPIKAALSAIRKGEVADSQVKVDVVAIAQNADNRAKLARLSAASGGAVLDADDATQIEALFEDEAQALAQQVLVTATPPEELLGTDGEVVVSIRAGGETYTDSAFVSLPAVGSPPAATPELAPPPKGWEIPRSAMLLGLGAAALGIALLMLTAFSGALSPQQDAVDRSIEAYTRQGAKRLAAANAQQQVSVTQQAVGAAARVLENNKGLEATLGNRLEAAGMQLKPAEWLLLHAGITVLAGLVGLLIGSGSILLMLVGLALGAGVPWLFLGFKRSRRLKAFNAQLADTLQLMAGSLSAGLSLAQSADTVVREGTDPMAHEFRRALVETRLGVEIDDALAGIADRMQSKDFEWIVMAIRIQREVGGNLAELLTKVSETIREREFLQRQVQSLSAEGRLSVWILGGLPPAFMAYLMVANRAYLNPLITTKLGWVMLFVMALLLTTGIFWMKKVVKVNV